MVYGIYGIYTTYPNSWFTFTFLHICCRAWLNRKFGSIVFSLDVCVCFWNLWFLFWGLLMFYCEQSVAITLIFFLPSFWLIKPSLHLWAKRTAKFRFKWNKALLVEQFISILHLYLCKDPNLNFALYTWIQINQSSCFPKSFCIHHNSTHIGIPRKIESKRYIYAVDLDTMKNLRCNLGGKTELDVRYG